MPQTIAIAIANWIVAAAAEAGVTLAVSYTAVLAATTVLTYAAAAALLGAAAKALGPSQPTGNGRSLEVNVTDATAPARIVLGQLKVGGVNVIPPFNSGANGEILHQILAIAGHDCSAMSDVYFNQDIINSVNIGTITGASTDGQVTGASIYTGKAYIRRYLGTTTDAMDYRLNAAFPSAFTSDFRGRGVAKLIIDYVFDQSVYASGFPSASVVVNGAKCYDPRLDSSPGANPTNPTYIAWTQNPALQLAWYIMSPLGGSYLASEIDWNLVVAAANVCDTSITGANIDPTSTAQPRYRCNLLLQATDDFMGNCKLITDTMLGRLQYRDGLWRIYAGAWASPTHALDQSCFIGPVSIQASAPRDQRYNGVRCFFVNAVKNWQRVECYPRLNSTYATADGSESIQKQVEIPGITYEYQAQRVAEFLLRASRNQITVSGKMGPRFMKLGLWETVTFTWADMGWVSKTFRIIAYTVNPNGTVDVGLQEEQSGDWNDLLTAEYNNPSTSTIPATNPTNPSAPLNFSAELLVNGTIKFGWDQPLVYPDQTRYQLIRSIVSTDASVGSIVWEGAANKVSLEMPHPAAWYWARAKVNTIVSPYAPGTSGTLVSPYHTAADVMRLNQDPEFTLSTSMNDIWKGPANWGNSLTWISSTGGLIGGKLSWAAQSHSGVAPIEIPQVYGPSVNSNSGVFWGFGQQYKMHVRWRITQAFSIVGATTLSFGAALQPWTGVGSPILYAPGGNFPAQPGAVLPVQVFSAGTPLNTWFESIMAGQLMLPSSGWGNGSPITHPYLSIVLSPPYGLGGNWKTGAMEFDHVSVVV